MEHFKTSVISSFLFFSTSFNTPLIDPQSSPISTLTTTSDMVIAGGTRTKPPKTDPLNVDVLWNQLIGRS